MVMPKFCSCKDFPPNDGVGGPRPWAVWRAGSVRWTQMANVKDVDAILTKRQKWIKEFDSNVASKPCRIKRKERSVLGMKESEY